uniref:ATP-dependent DNA helicase RecG n=1 Tax=Candidatus Kentrum sp. FW TaxID=2126338 RepID=A0A450TTR8_9GAMM|nr:MAG: ATP-dependent DNA helicase RecG [Candidatus Kentron sp. FW]
MTKIELMELIRNGESSFVEFKRDGIDNRALAKELVAFGNHRGGRVLLGVEDDGSISGIARSSKELEEWVMTACRDKIRPPIIPDYEVVRDMAPGKDVAIISVEPGFTVHSVWHKSHDYYHIRVGTQSREADREELQRLFQRRGSIRFETQPVSGSSMKDLSLPRLTEYFRDIRGQTIPAGDDTDQWKRLLHNTEFLTDSALADGDGGDYVCSVAGMLLFGQSPKRFLPHMAVDVAVFPGTEKDYDASFRGAATSPLVGFRDERGDVLEPGIVDQVMNMLQPHLSREELEGARRVRKWDYPEEAIREALVNAVVHRDYLLSATSTEVTLYTDRLEIVSPGRPPNGIDSERMRAGCRNARNQLLKDVMRDYGYMEHMGMGIPRKIIKLMEERVGTTPELIVAGENFSLVLRKSPLASLDI